MKHCNACITILCNYSKNTSTISSIDLPLELSQSLPDTYDSFQRLTGARGSRSEESVFLPSHTPETKLCHNVKSDDSVFT